ncbi:hypothetical protein F4678DRAFT_442757 [Xylaria arbuscula]|nr:hypothetical protein F4678DRAFT_442757 [Xylaria arbuscula]
MRATALTLLSAAARLASAEITPGTIVVEKFLCNSTYQNTTILVHPEYDFNDTKILNQVSSLYQIAPEYSYFCFAYKPDGTFYSDDWFGIDKPLHLSKHNVVVQAITCRIE